jgi:hypothetical protein
MLVFYAIFVHCVVHIGFISLVALYGCREAGGIARDDTVFAQVDVRIRPLSVEARAWVAGGALSGAKNEKPEKATGEIVVASPRVVGGYAAASAAAAANGSGGDDKFVTVGDRVFYFTGDVGVLWTDERGVRKVR